MKLISKIIYYILSPIKEYKVSFLFFILSTLIPELLETTNFLNYILDYFLTHIALSCFISYFLISIAYIFSKFSKSIGIILIFTFHIILFTFLFADIFLLKIFNTHINAYILQLIDETNNTESLEFIKTYLLRWSFVKVFIFILLFLFFEYVLFFIIKKRQSNKRKTTIYKYLEFAFALYILYCVGYSVKIKTLFSTKDWTYNDSCIWDTEWENNEMWKSYVFNTFQAFLQYFNERKALEICAKNQSNLDVEKKDSQTSDIVIIIGESYNRHHSNLYGYSLKTCPKLSSLENLYVFKDVISPVNATTQAFHYFLSMASTDSETKWYDTPLFPAIFKKAGYNVIFYSNEFVKEANMNAYDASCGFFNHPCIEPQIFTHRNTKKYKYDEGLIEEFKNCRNKIEKDSLNLIFFHLYGQHSDPLERYPINHTFFNTSHYNHRKELSISEKQELANYDNATLYNDSIVYDIINMYKDKDALIIYFADHGEEINDCRPFIGRSRDFNTLGAPCLHCQLDIPFFIYLSEIYCKKHPEIKQSVEDALNNSFMIDDLPHLLLDITNLKTDYFEPKRSIINKDYNKNRKRLITDYGLSPFQDYDSICNLYGEWTIGYNKK